LQRGDGAAQRGVGRAETALQTGQNYSATASSDSLSFFVFNAIFFVGVRIFDGTIERGTLQM
jgi:hypothetical protein